MKDLRVAVPRAAGREAASTATTSCPRTSTTSATAMSSRATASTLVAVYTPGHASDHLCYYLPEEKALFTGDVVLSGSTSVIPAGDGDLLDYMNSLRRLQGLDVRRIYSAHGPVIEDGPGRIAEYIAHRLMRERQILEALGDGLDTIPAMVKKIYAEVPEKLHMMAAQSVESHLRKLAREDRVRETPEPTRRRAGTWCADRALTTASLFVCVGCCCGRTGHGGALAPAGRLKSVARKAFEASGLSGRVRMAFTECLGPCSESNVVFLYLQAAPVWLRRVNTPELFAGALRYANEATRNGAVEPPRASAAFVLVDGRRHRPRTASFQMRGPETGPPSPPTLRGPADRAAPRLPRAGQRRRDAASTSAWNRRSAAGSCSTSSSGCHCTASTKPRAPGSSTASIDLVVRPRHGPEAVAEVLDRLVVEAVHARRSAPARSREQRCPARSSPRACDRCARRPGCARCSSPKTSGTCWCSVPLSATFRTWMPRQIASSGTPVLDRLARDVLELELVALGGDQVRLRVPRLAEARRDRCRRRPSSRRPSSARAGPARRTEWNGVSSSGTPPARSTARMYDGVDERAVDALVRALRRRGDADDRSRHEVEPSTGGSRAVARVSCRRHEPRLRLLPAAPLPSYTPTHTVQIIGRRWAVAAGHPLASAAAAARAGGGRQCRRCGGCRGHDARRRPHGHGQRGGRRADPRASGRDAPDVAGGGRRAVSAPLDASSTSASATATRSRRVSRAPWCRPRRTRGAPRSRAGARCRSRTSPRHATSSPSAASRSPTSPRTRWARTSEKYKRWPTSARALPQGRARVPRRARCSCWRSSARRCGAWRAPRRRPAARARPASAPRATSSTAARPRSASPSSIARKTVRSRAEDLAAFEVEVAQALHRALPRLSRWRRAASGARARCSCRC